MSNSKGEKKGYSRAAIMGIIGMLTFGTGTMISSKLMLDMSACPMPDPDWYVGYGTWDHGECPLELRKKFEKPWFQTAAMFSAMFFCIFGHIGVKLHQRRQKREAAGGLTLDAEAPLVPAPVEEKKSELAAYLLVGFPSVFDMIATTLMTYGLIYIDVSVMQMLRGSMVIFASIMNVLFLKRKIRGYQWFSVVLTAVACIVVGISCILASLGSTTARPWNQQLYGICLVLASQLVQSCQIVCEDFLLSNVDAEPLQVVGMEGAWGGAITIGIMWPLMMWVFTGEDHGAAEDFQDTFYMMADNHSIITATVVYWICILFLNWSGMVVTNEMSSVVRTIFEAVRTAAIWVTDLAIYYWISPHSVYGEAWTTYSWMQLAGFFLLIFSSQIYNKLAMFPKYFRYSFPEDEEDESKSESKPLLAEEEL
eukprot:gnl/Dysnectes_brevis/45_a56_11038.p1 GENE.gnl/Dysnectes_brevis/45_a56_11038~~gnl/Dysnectes_brevis/45_a56_11038.p1  ORF type:complete len:423 (+),score=119.08 gnl/Dysnectes_brevis/45_a56_11038:40-1308(+)